MNRTEARHLVHSAFFRIVRQPQPLSLTEFYASTIKNTIPSGSPSGWSGFWVESVAVEIQAAVMTRREYIFDFDAQWLKDNESKTWEALLDHMSERLGPLS